MVFSKLILTCQDIWDEEGMQENLLDVAGLTSGTQHLHV
jgi:hypothetical protein